jgi:hypothetical protein
VEKEKKQKIQRKNKKTKKTKSAKNTKSSGPDNNLPKPKGTKKTKPREGKTHEKVGQRSVLWRKAKIELFCLSCGKRHATVAHTRILGLEWETRKKPN